MNVIHAYAAVQKPIHQTTAVKTVRSMLNRYIRRPPKNRKTEMCRRVGNASTAQGRCNLLMPSAKKERIRARLWGPYRGWVILTYRRTHCLRRVARSAQARLIVKLRNQSELTQMAYFGGENFMDGFTRVEGIET